MRTFVLCILVLFFSSKSIAQFAGISQYYSNVPIPPMTLNPDAVAYWDFAGLEFINKTSFVIRPYIGRGTTYYILPILTEAIANDRQSGNVKFSINPLFYIPYLTASSLSEKKWLLRLFYYILYAPGAIPNISLYFPIISDQFWMGLEQRTDYYLLNNPAKIYTESAIGARVRFLKLIGEFRFAYPLTEGFLENKKPYFSASLYWRFNEDDKLFLIP
jgi:hypothetical protein